MTVASVRIATDRLSRMVLEHAWRLPNFVPLEKGEQPDISKMVTLDPGCLVGWLVLHGPDSIWKTEDGYPCWQSTHLQPDFSTVLLTYWQLFVSH